MKTLYLIYSFLILLNIFEKISLQYNSIYDPEDFIDYINNKEILSKEGYDSIINYLINIFNDVYAFNEVSINPEQPSIQNDYHNKIDIFMNFVEIRDKINNNEINKPYDFYRELMTKISELKDSHIQINWNLLNLKSFIILSPVEFNIKEIDGEPKIFISCLSEDFAEFMDEDINMVLESCENNIDSPVKLINGQDPFDYINNFGGNFVSTKNIHATFSFKLSYHNNVPLSDYPLNVDELKELKVEFDSNDELSTKFYIATDSEEDIFEENGLRNLNARNKLFNNKNKKNKNINKNKLKKKRRLNNIYWTYKSDDENLKCYTDTVKEINLYYLSSFQSEDKNNFYSTLQNCITLFDGNKYPIVVINDLNNGGYVSLSQFFLGIISPLVSIDLFKGRLRITESLKDTKDIEEFIETNLTNTKDCLRISYNELINESKNVEYDNNTKSNLTQIFFINNISLHNDIENARKKMNNKRKPTEILIFTDGYTFSAASLFLQYLQKKGGGIIASYMGNPKYKNEEYFDISQSPTPVFPSSLLKIFSPENYILLNQRIIEEDKSNYNFEEEWDIQISGIQSFYNEENTKKPLEYELILPDIQTNIYEVFEEETYEKFINESIKIFEKFKTECNPNNKNLVKVSEECDKEFKYKYIHGGYECGNDGKWSNKCVPSYCDEGYFFDQKNKQCIKDVCSSIPVQIITEETTIPVPTTKEETTIPFQMTTEITEQEETSNTEGILPKEPDKKNGTNVFMISFYNIFYFILFVIF